MVPWTGGLTVQRMLLYIYNRTETREDSVRCNATLVNREDGKECRQSCMLDGEARNDSTAGREHTQVPYQCQCAG